MANTLEATVAAQADMIADLTHKLNVLRDHVNDMKTNMNDRFAIVSEWMEG